MAVSRRLHQLQIIVVISAKQQQKLVRTRKWIEEFKPYLYSSVGGSSRAHEEPKLLMLMKCSGSVMCKDQMNRMAATNLGSAVKCARFVLLNIKVNHATWMQRLS
jgi:hypothetical protein